MFMSVINRFRIHRNHWAYQRYRAALMLDRNDTVALAAIRRYCKRFRLDIRNPAINPPAMFRP
jgi:hypothetical protein